MTISSDVRRYIVKLIAASENADLIAKTDLLISAFETAGKNAVFNLNCDKDINLLNKWICSPEVKRYSIMNSAI